jgi:hypothetical protein
MQVHLLHIPCNSSAELVEALRSRYEIENIADENCDILARSAIKTGETSVI